MNEQRYNRLQQMEWWRQERIASARALIAGCGALGNEVLKNLLLLGWGHIGLIDFDSVSPSNLSRSVFFGLGDVGRKKTQVLRERAGMVNSDCRVLALDGDLRLRLSAGLVARSDVVFGCLDNVHGRLALSGLVGQAGVLFVDGGLAVWEGTVSVFLGDDGPCYACGLTAEDFRELNLRRSCPTYAARAARAGGVPTTPTVSSLVAAQMVQVALKHVHGRKAFPRLPTGQQLRFDTANERFWKITMPRNPECLVHPVRTRPTILPDAGWDQPWSRVLAAVGALFGGARVALHLPIAVLESWICSCCGACSDSPRAYVVDDPLACPQCGEEAVPLLRNQLTGDEPFLHLSPAQMQFPPWLWVTAVDEAGRQEVLELGQVAGELSSFDRSAADALTE